MIQDVRGRNSSEGEFYKYTGEANDGYDTVEWIAKQVWSNGQVFTDGPSYLCHVQTSMAILRPPHLTAMFCNKGKRREEKRREDKRRNFRKDDIYIYLIHPPLSLCYRSFE